MTPFFGSEEIDTMKAELGLDSPLLPELERLMESCARVEISCAAAKLLGEKEGPWDIAHEVLQVCINGVWAFTFYPCGAFQHDPLLFDDVKSVECVHMRLCVLLMLAEEHMELVLQTFAMHQAIDATIFGRNLRQILRDQGITIGEFLSDWPEDTQTLIDFLGGQCVPGDVDTIAAIGRVLGIDFERLLQGIDHVLVPDA